MARYGYARGRHGAPRNAKGQFVKGPSRKTRKSKSKSKKRPTHCPPCAKKKASRRAKGRRRNARGQFA
jgi:hypothetical protein